MDKWVVEFGQSDELVARIYAGGDDAVKAICDYADECKAYCRSLVAFAKSSKPCWIPVEERLPKKNENTLIFVRGNCFATVGTYSPMFEDWWSLQGDRMQPERSVTHWMPLPEPPEVK